MRIKDKRIYILVCIFAFCIFPSLFLCYALNLDKMKVHYLNGDYPSAIKDGEKMLSSVSGGYAENLDELYYLLGLSYMKQGNLLRASDIFEIILNEFKNSRFKEEAKFSLADTYFLKGDYDKAEELYKSLIKDNPGTKLKAQAYSRIADIGLKNGDAQQRDAYSSRIKQEFPNRSEIKSGVSTLPDLELRPEVKEEVFYTVQVGSFSSSSNARNLVDGLKAKGYPAYLEESISQGGDKIFRVRVGKFTRREEAVALEKKLSLQGHPTKIYP